MQTPIVNRGDLFQHSALSAPATAPAMSKSLADLFFHPSATAGASSPQLSRAPNATTPPPPSAELLAHFMRNFQQRCQPAPSVASPEALVALKREQTSTPIRDPVNSATATAAAVSASSGGSGSGVGDTSTDSSSLLPFNQSSLHLSRSETDEHDSWRRKAREEVKIQPYLGNDGNERFTCPLCGQDEIEDRAQLTQHLQTHQAVVKRDDGKHVCCFCSSELSSNSSLERHLLTHTNHRPFVCEFCDKAFTTNGNLSRHIRTSHGGQNGLPPAPLSAADSVDGLAPFPSAQLGLSPQTPVVPVVSTPPATTANRSPLASHPLFNSTLTTLLHNLKNQATTPALSTTVSSPDSVVPNLNFNNFLLNAQLMQNLLPPVVAQPNRSSQGIVEKKRALKKARLRAGPVKWMRKRVFRAILTQSGVEKNRRRRLNTKTRGGERPQKSKKPLVKEGPAIAAPVEPAVAETDEAKVEAIDLTRAKSSEHVQLPQQPPALLYPMPPNPFLLSPPSSRPPLSTALMVGSPSLLTTPPAAISASMLNHAMATSTVTDCTSSTASLLSSSGTAPPDMVVRKKNSYKDAPKLISCPVPGCKQKFPWNSSLKRHILTHTPHKPFSCTRCAKSFSTKSNRERHMERVHRVSLKRQKGRQPQGQQNSGDLALNDEVSETFSADAISTGNAASVAKSPVGPDGEELTGDELICMNMNDKQAEDISNRLLMNAGSPVVEPNPGRLFTSNDSVSYQKRNSHRPTATTLPPPPLSTQQAEPMLHQFENRLPPVLANNPFVAMLQMQDPERLRTMFSLLSNAFPGVTSAASAMASEANSAAQDGFACYECGRVFTAKQSLNRHIRTAHPLMAQRLDA